MTQAAATVTAETSNTVRRLSNRENSRMADYSPPRELLEFATQFRQPPAPGIEVVQTAHYRLTLQPDYPIPGPNSAAWVRCRERDPMEVIDEVRAVFAGRRLPLMWTLDPGTDPPDFGPRLEARGVMPEPHSPEVAVMILPIDVDLEPPRIPGLEIIDALADAELFRQADAVNAEAFHDAARDPGPQERRRANQLAAGNRRVLLATIDGEPAGSAGMTLYPPHGAIINGGAVRERFRGRGVYRALVAERLRIAREAGVPGLQVWGGPMSAPILEKLGFRKVGWRRFYLDRSTT
jgi:GNAT superfamily N-acetyltransferase